MNLGPMTWLVVMGLAILLIAGIVILARSGGGSGQPCSRCKHVNRRAASFCARCGQSLGE
jgi:hypothetical protein